MLYYYQIKYLGYSRTTRTTGLLEFTCSLFPARVIMTELTRRSLLIAIDFINVIIHGVGFYLLISLYRRNTTKSTQALYLLNLAFTEQIWNVSLVLKDTIQLLRLLRDDDDYLSDVYMYNNIFIYALGYDTVLAMLYFTGDRLAHIVLHAKYEQYWNMRKTRILIAATWFCNMCISAVHTVS